MSKQDVSIPTADGQARAYVFTPDQGSGPWPAVIMYMDALAIRPALFEMGQRLADAGYYVLLPDMFWRKPYAEMDPKQVFGADEGRAGLMKLMGEASNPEWTVKDTGAFLAWLDQQPQVKHGKVGLAGYCMGGGMAIRAAAAYPDRVAAVGSFHAARLATDAPDSPHLLAPKIKAKLLIAGADQDAGFDEAQKDRLAQALEAAGVDARVEIWRGALHGWVPTDTPVHNPEAADRSWRELEALLDETLK